MMLLQRFSDCKPPSVAPSHRRRLTRAVLCACLLLLWTGVPHTDGPPPKRIGFSILEDYDKGDDLADVAKGWDGSPAAYNDVLKRASDAIKAVAPDTTVLLGGMVYPDTAWIEHVCGDGHNGRRIDVVSFHAYPETWTPREVDLEHYLGP